MNEPVAVKSILEKKKWKKKNDREKSKKRNKIYKYHFKICSVKKCMNTAHVYKVIFNFSVKFDTKDILHYCSFKK